MTDCGDGVGLDWERRRVLRAGGWGGRGVGMGMGVAVSVVGRSYRLWRRRGGEVRVQGRCTAVLVRTD